MISVRMVRSDCDAEVGQLYPGCRYPFSERPCISCNGSGNNPAALKRQQWWLGTSAVKPSGDLTMESPLVKTLLSPVYRERTYGLVGWRGSRELIHYSLLRDLNNIPIFHQVEQKGLLPELAHRFDLSRHEHPLAELFLKHTQYGYMAKILVQLESVRDPSMRECPSCNGAGRIIKGSAEEITAWQPRYPEAGDHYQIWCEGSPLTPPIGTREQLIHVMCNDRVVINHLGIFLKPHEAEVVLNDFLGKNA